MNTLSRRTVEDNEEILVATSALPVPSAVIEGHFSYGYGGLRLRHVAKAPLRTLKQLCLSNVTEAQLRTATGPWISVQLEFYDIPHNQLADRETLIGVLRGAVENGKCNQLPPRVKAIEESLRDQFRSATQKYDEARRLERNAAEERLRTKVQEQRLKEFKQKEGPCEELKFDVDLFLGKYYLDGPSAQPCPSKTPLPMVLDLESPPGLFDAVKNIPKLAARRLMGKLVIYWDMEDVDGIVEGEPSEADPSDGAGGTEMGAPSEASWGSAASVKVESETTSTASALSALPEWNRVPDAHMEIANGPPHTSPTRNWMLDHPHPPEVVPTAAYCEKLRNRMATVQSEHTRLAVQEQPNPTKDANENFRSFLKVYLGIEVDASGFATVVARKSSVVVGLNATFNYRRQLNRVVTKFPRLYLRIPLFFQDDIVVGWIKADVEAAAARLDKAYLREMDEYLEEAGVEVVENMSWREEKWHKRLDLHRKYLMRILPEADRSSFGLAQLAGSYIVRCEQLETFRVLPQQTMDIFPSKSRHGVVALLNLDKIEGILLIGTSKRAVRCLKDEQLGGNRGADDSRCADGGGGGGDSGRLTGSAPGRKRKLDSGTGDGFNNTAAASSPKRPRQAPSQGSSPATRVYFQFICRDSGREYDETNSDMILTGHLDFDSQQTFAKGVLDLAPDIYPLSIYKIKDQPNGEEPELCYEGTE